MIEKLIVTFSASVGGDLLVYSREVGLFKWLFPIFVHQEVVYEIKRECHINNVVLTNSIRTYRPKAKATKRKA